jgi:hypothetical protein
MNRKAILAGFLLPFLLVVPGFSKGAVSDKKSSSSWEEVYCVGEDALNSADLTLDSLANDDLVKLTVDTGKGNDTGALVRTYKVHLKKGSFKKMIVRGKIEIVMSSDKHPETASGGETKYAALVELTRDRNGDFRGLLALDGSVYELSCPQNLKKYFACRD